MNYLLLLMVILFGAIKTSAQGGIQNVHEVSLSTSTITQTISVTTQTYVDMASTTSSGTLAGYWSIEVFNPTGNGTIVCGFDTAISTLVANAWYGREIAAAAEKHWKVSSNRKLYCQSLSTTAAQRVTVTQYK